MRAPKEQKVRNRDWPKVTQGLRTQRPSRKSERKGVPAARPGGGRSETQISRVPLTGICRRPGKKKWSAGGRRSADHTGLPRGETPDIRSEDAVRVNESRRHMEGGEKKGNTTLLYSNKGESRTEKEFMSLRKGEQPLMRRRERQPGTLDPDHAEYRSLRLEKGGGDCPRGKKKSFPNFFPKKIRGGSRHREKEKKGGGGGGAVVEDLAGDEEWSRQSEESPRGEMTVSLISCKRHLDQSCAGCCQKKRKVVVRKKKGKAAEQEALATTGLFRQGKRIKRAFAKWRRTEGCSLKGNRKKSSHLLSWNRRCKGIARRSTPHSPEPAVFQPGSSIKEKKRSPGLLDQGKSTGAGAAGGVPSAFERHGVETSPSWTGKERKTL